MSKSIMVVGEARGDEQSRWLLRQLLSHVGIELNDCHYTVVFSTCNSTYQALGDKAGGIVGKPAIDKKYVKREYQRELDRLQKEIEINVPNVIIALGEIASWALLNTTGIRSIRGATTTNSKGVKVVPTFHPAQVIKDWSMRPIVMSDFNKAKYESGFADLRRPRREVWIEPTIEDIAEYERLYINDAERLSADIETKGDQITCIGFAPAADKALVIPFYADGAAGKNYWSNPADELKAWDYVRKWCATKPTVFQNGLYDMQFLWRSYGIPTLMQAHDTMLLHHAYQMEMQKGLGFLATLYTHEASWKHLLKTSTLKQGDN